MSAAARELFVSRGFGTVVALDVAGGAVAAVRAALPHWWREAAGGAVEPGEVFRVDDAAHAEFEVSMLELWVAEHAADRVFVHAAAVGWQGRAILLPGRSHTGKTSLAAALLRAGASYLSDEYAVLDADGLAHSYPRPLSARQPDGSRRRFGPQEYGATAETGTLPVGLIALLRHEPGAAWAVGTVSAARAVLGLLDNAPAARERGDRVIATLTATVGAAIAVEGTRGDADAAAARLLRLMS